MSLFLLLLILAIVLGIVGVAVHGLLYLLAVAILLFVADLAFFGLRRSRGTGRHRVR
ncbi:hypothetical protein [Kitasatospora sp. NPDC057223]|uniref:hypothetical protein n=1 Tax=Kitasatospora sp. NPDC057223 TaxID=3346055 RepID=UPI0036392E8A